MHTAALPYAGRTSTFRAELPLADVALEPGNFEVVLYAARRSEGNTGTDRMVVSFR